MTKINEAFPRSRERGTTCVIGGRPSRFMAGLLAGMASIPLAGAMADDGDHQDRHKHIKDRSGQDTRQAPETVEVRAERHSLAGSLEQARQVQKNAPNIINVMPQSEIKKQPNFVLGDAVRRLPGASVINKSGEARSVQIRGLDPNLNGITFEGVPLPAGSINGAGRAVPLDAIPAALAGGLELTKTNRPDEDASALGGQLNIVARQVPADGQPFGEIIAGGGTRTPHGNNIFQGTISGGSRFGLDGNPFAKTTNDAYKPFSVVFFATATDDWLQMDDFQPAYTNAANRPSNALSRLSEVDYRNHKVRDGYGGTLSWQVDHNTSLYFTAFDSDLDAPNLRTQLIYNNLNTQYAPAAGRPGVATANATLQQEDLDAFTRDEERVYKFGGDTGFAHDIRLDYYGSYASNFIYTPYSYDATFTRPGTVPVLVDNVSNPSRPTATILNGVNPLDYGPYRLSALSLSRQNDIDQEWDGHVQVSLPQSLGPVDGSFHFGTGLRLREKTQNDPIQTYGGYPALSAGALAGDEHLSTFGGAYDLGHPVGMESIRRLIDDHPALLRENAAADAITNAASRIDDNENIYSAWGQYEGHWGRLGILAGLRYEKTDGVYRGAINSNASGSAVVTPTSNGQEYGNIFPTVQFRYDITNRMIARATYSSAIARPGFNQITPSTTVNIGAQSVSTGNAALKPTTGDNYDVDVEYYGRAGGIASFGLFDKEFRNYVVTTTLLEAYPGISGTTAVSTYGNVSYAFARGFEANYRQQFLFLPGWWSGFGVGGNYTYVLTRGASRNGQVETLPDTTPHAFNATAFYQRGRFDIELDANFVGLTLTSLGETPKLDNYVQPYLNFDLGARYAVTPKLTMWFQARNLTNENQNATQGSGSFATVERQQFGSAYLVGLDAKF